MDENEHFVSFGDMHVLFLACMLIWQKLYSTLKDHIS
jgi:hypothetical protein